MARRHFINGAAPTTTTGSMTSGATTFDVADLSSYPATLPYALAIDADNASFEVVLVTAKSGNTITACTRGYDGTGAQAHASSATVEHVAISMDYDEANAHVNASTGVHGIAGAVVGTTDSQTLSNKTLASPASTGTPSGPGWVPIGGVLPFAGVSAPSGFALADGSLVSRATYATLFSTMTFTQTCSATSGNTTLTVTDSTKLNVGMPLEGTNIPAGTTVSSITDATHVVISHATSGTIVSAAIRFFPFGNGDGSTTFGLPSLCVGPTSGKGAVPLGADPLTYGPTDPVIGALGATGGAKSHNHNLSDNGQAAITNPGGSSNLSMRIASSGNWNSTDLLTGAGSHSSSVVSRSTGTGLTGTTDQAGLLPPYVAMNYIIRTL